MLANRSIDQAIDTIYWGTNVVRGGADTLTTQRRYSKYFKETFESQIQKLIPNIEVLFLSRKPDKNVLKYMSFGCHNGGNIPENYTSKFLYRESSCDNTIALIKYSKTLLEPR